MSWMPVSCGSIERRAAAAVHPSGKQIHAGTRAATSDNYQHPRVGTTATR